MSLLAVRNLAVSFQVAHGWGRRQNLLAVRNVDLDLNRGQALGLVGESGCGKSTLARAIMLLTPIDSGSIVLDGTDLTKLSAGTLRTTRRRMQMIFQDPRSSLNPTMSIARAVAEPLVIHEGRLSKQDLAKRVGGLLDQVGLPSSVARAYPVELSGGQRQRVAIARALACKPDVLIADEPTSALDVSVQAQVMNLLARLQREHHLAMLLVSHNLELVRIVCSDMAVMYLGRIVERGPTGELCNNPVHPYTKALMDAVPKIDAADISPSRLEGDVPSPIDLPSGCSFAPRCPKKNKPKACFAAEPPLEKAGRGHLVACHLADVTKNQ
ncbi:MAG: ABC transporter ATP-binding protein [Deltaproteobacteria bacterium]|nr:ABC transporter ATP-binding protein [Deltaproteobacteria bacterium]